MFDRCAECPMRAEKYRANGPRFALRWRLYFPHAGSAGAPRPLPLLPCLRSRPAFLFDPCRCIPCVCLLACVSVPPGRSVHVRVGSRAAASRFFTVRVVPGGWWVVSRSCGGRGVPVVLLPGLTGGCPVSSCSVLCRYGVHRTPPYRTRGYSRHHVASCDIPHNTRITRTSRAHHDPARTPSAARSERPNPTNRTRDEAPAETRREGREGEGSELSCMGLRNARALPRATSSLRSPRMDEP